MEKFITIVSLGIMFIGATVAIFTCYLEDTFLQRVALVGVCFGSLSLADHAAKTEPHISVVVMSVSGAIWVVATGHKLWRKKHGFA
jgi:spore maturation protein SpmB